MFRVGQKVVCIKRGQWTNPLMHGNEVLPQFHDVYTVREICHAGRAIRLEEITNPLNDYLEDGSVSEATFCATRFRPVVSRPTDISIFTAMLTPRTSQVVRAR